MNLNDVTRAIQNSRGRPIHPSEDALESFWEWFGSSCVTDSSGRPEVVYHGTGSDIHAFDVKKVGSKHADVLDEAGLTGEVDGALFYFTDDIATAEWYALDSDGGSGGANIMPVYLSLNNPLIVNFRGEGREYLADEIVKAKEGGHDGVIALNFDDGAVSTHYIAFDPAQIKSAIGNTGMFNTNDPRLTDGDPLEFSATFDVETNEDDQPVLPSRRKGFRP
jgi:hypothetical protein